MSPRWKAITAGTVPPDATVPSDLTRTVAAGATSGEEFAKRVVELLFEPLNGS